MAIDREHSNFSLARLPLSARGSDCSRIFIFGSWLAVAVMLAMVFWMSAHTGGQLDTENIVGQVKAWLASTAAALVGHPVDVSPVGHFTEFLLLGLAMANALSLHIDLKRACFASVVLCSMYGVTDEIHQIFVPTRSCDPADWLVDTIAAALGSLVIFFVLRRKETHGQE